MNLMCDEVFFIQYMQYRSYFIHEVMVILHIGMRYATSSTLLQGSIQVAAITVNVCNKPIVYATRCLQLWSLCFVVKSNQMQPLTALTLSNLHQPKSTRFEASGHFCSNGLHPSGSGHATQHLTPVLKSIMVVIMCLWYRNG